MDVSNKTSVRSKKLDPYKALELYNEDEIVNPKTWRFDAPSKRKWFIDLYPIDSIENLTIEEYCIGDESFTKRIRVDLQGLASMGNAYPDTFGIYARKETNELVLSKTFNRICNGDVNLAFITIKKEIVKLLKGFDTIGFEAVNGINLNNMFIYKLLIIYYPDRVFPVCARGTLQKYCECVGLKFSLKEKMYVGIQKLQDWKSKVSIFEEWDDFKLMSFCDFLVRHNYCIDGDELLNNKPNNNVINEKKWILTIQNNIDDIYSKLQNSDIILWKQFDDINIGDVIYFYFSGGINRIVFKYKVNNTNLKNDHDINNIQIIDDHSNSNLMELERVSLFETDLLNVLCLEEHGYKYSIKPISASSELGEYIDVIEYLLNVDEMDPDKHDGSYELARETVESYKRIGDLSFVNYRDLNLLYHMVLGTWKLSIDQKKKSIYKSNLPDSEKDRLVVVLEKIWNKSINAEYDNSDIKGPSIGMFGSGFYSFDSNDDGLAARTFLGLCIDILDLDDDEKIFEVAEKYLSHEILGLKAASASAMLHCIKPYTFPILNTNFGNNTIYEYFGLKLNKMKMLTTYIPNCRLIKYFRDNNFTVKNYRVYDIAARMVNNVSDQNNNDHFWPSYDEYPVDLTKDDWLRFLNEVEYPYHKGCMRVLKCFYDIGGVASPSVLSQKYLGHSMVYTSSVMNFSRRAINFFDYTPCPEGDTTWYFPIAFQGKEGDGNDKGTYIYKMRPELMDALKEINLDDIDLIYKNRKEDMDNSIFNRNTILYGPPGTGKTYSSILYAVGICENKQIEELKYEDYGDVFDRFKSYKDEGRIAFTTFHQSYGYEEFIEGIRPVIDESDEDNSDIRYTIEDGIFKKFCNQAMLPSDVSDSVSKYGLNKNPTVWKVSLETTGDNPTRTECLENGHIRIGWDQYGEVVTDDIDFSEYGGKTVLNSFMNKIQVGDVVLSCYSASTIDAIGVVTGDYEWHPEYDKYKRLRKVKWLSKDINYNILDLNGGTSMTLSTVYKLKMSVSDVFKILDEVGFSDKTLNDSSSKNYVFIIDEINRGNISKIFGELITLVEETKRLGCSEAAEAILPYSHTSFGIPKNVYILGTMNTADRSIALMDTALRRRFSFEEMMPNSDVLRDMGINTITSDGQTIDVADMLDVINERIEYLYDREHTIGHAFFTVLADDPSIDKLAEIFENKVIPLLQEYFYEDYGKIQLVLGDNGKKEDEFKFILDKSIKPKDVFQGDTSELDLPEKKYIIQKSAFNKIQSYKTIADNL